ncbi:MAG: MFS transporter [Gammaproteobacteria bacterium]|nr:MFS transporter [Gammaproteobacteria bacterium]
MAIQADATPSPAPEATAAGDAVSRRLRINFGSGALGMSLVLNTTGVILAPFMTNFLGIAATSVATLLLASKLYDVVTDPLMGVLSDRTRSRWGRRRPYLFIGGIISAAGFFLAFNPPEFASQTQLMVFMLAALLVTYTGYTVFNIPYLAMPAEMTRGCPIRTSLRAHRIIFVNVGGLLAVSSLALVEWLGNDRGAHGTMGWIYATLIVLASAYCFRGTERARQTESVGKRFSFGRQVETAFQNRPLILLLGAKLCQLLGLAAGGAAGVYFKVVILGMSYTLTTLYLVTITLVIIAFIPLWSAASRRFGKRSVYMICTVSYALVTVTWLLATAQDPLSYVFVRAVFLGIFGSGVLVMGPSLLPDAVEYDYLRTGMRREGTMSAFYTTVEKFAFAIGPALALYILGWFGYQEGTEGMQIEQPESAITAIYLCAGLVPAVLYGLSLVFLFKYDLSEDRLKELRAASGAARGNA